MAQLPNEYGEEEGPLKSSHPGQGYNARNASMNTSGIVYVEPTLEESVLFQDLTDNLRQTVKKIKAFEADLETLQNTYNDCEDLVRNKFEALRQLLNDREDLHLSQLGQRYNDRQTKLQTQIDTLETHHNENESVRHNCRQLVQTMTQLEQEEERYNQIKKLVDDCIGSSPNVQQVPIDLRYTFDTEKQTSDLIQKYGHLHFKRIETGRSLPYTRKGYSVITGNATNRSNNVRVNSKVNTNIENVNKNNNNNNINVRLPELDKFTMKFDKKVGAMCEIKLKDENDLKIDSNIFLHVECFVDKERKIQNWKEGQIDDEKHFALTKMNFDGKKYVGVLGTQDTYKPDLYIHGRGRLLYLEGEDPVLDTILKEGNWSDSNAAKIRAMEMDGGGMVMQEKDETNVNIGNENTMSLDDLPPKIKIRCDIIIGSETKPAKLITFQKDKNEYNLDAFYAKVRKLAKNDSGNFDITLNGNQNISNDNEFITHILSQAKGDPKGDLKDLKGIQATMR